MTRVALAPCTPFTVSLDLMRESIALARAYGVHAHTHTAETLDEEEYSLQHFGRRPIDLMVDIGWLGPDVWHAHVVHASPREIERLGRRAEEAAARVGRDADEVGRGRVG